MRLAPLFWQLFRFLLPPTLIGLTWIYTYPFLYGCSFPPAVPSELACHLPGSEQPGRAAETAPLRLLCLADPQLEGGSSVPDYELKRTWREQGVTGVIGRAGKRWRKQLDLWGNDRFLAHIYWMISWWTGPTHTVVLGDLLGSQWIEDEEFEKRRRRFWATVFKSGEMVGREISGKGGVEEGFESWERRVVAVAGNHDVGYAGDLNQERLTRWEDGFGEVNWEVRFRLLEKGGSNETTSTTLRSPLEASSTPELRLVVLNSMNLDSPALHPHLQKDTWEFLSSTLPVSSLTKPPPNTGTIILTHIPLHKTSSHCADEPFTSHFSAAEGGGIREQNLLSSSTSEAILNGLSAAGRSALVLDGHDHEGCDTFHYSHPETSDWTTEPFLRPRLSLRPNNTHLQHSPIDWDRSNGIREITVRSMMGEFLGNAGLLSAWWDAGEEKWKFEYESCAFGVQHIWWAGHVLALIEGALGVAALIRGELEVRRARREVGREKKGQ
ncbi:hypothetical protein B0A48_01150 [Cryoendolithus antarcticus]|uniref:Uncharacterized protein n=1 Tax=Cryoendolithus antarcticus TaxID=1507870 RepID=A0A1V8TSH6_9PEZI|nr:hypothetical protein B0A48_01150 [Cryoendolithus antarcticus]